jgi:hypothetical protein
MMQQVGVHTQLGDVERGIAERDQRLPARAIRLGRKIVDPMTPILIRT